MTSDEWFSLKDKKAQKISLQPDGMESCECWFLLVWLCSKNSDVNLYSFKPVSSIQPNPQPQTKSTDQTPNIMQNLNRHGNDFDKSKQDEVS